jgi:CheY-like chemotaxis protein
MTPKAEPARRPRLNHALPLRVLVVEDFVPFRQFILSTLASMRDLQVVGEVSDGLEALQKVVERPFGTSQRTRHPYEASESIYGSFQEELKRIEALSEIRSLS